MGIVQSTETIIIGVEVIKRAWNIKHDLDRTRKFFSRKLYVFFKCCWKIKNTTKIPVEKKFLLDICIACFVSIYCGESSWEIQNVKLEM